MEYKLRNSLEKFPHHYYILFKQLLFCFMKPKKRTAKQIISLFSILLLFSIIFSFNIVIADPPQVVGIGGYVLNSGSPEVGATVNVTNLNTSESTETTTNALGLYAAGLTASTGNIIQVNATNGSYTGSNTTTVDVALATQWCNVSVTLNSSISAQFTYSPSSPVEGERVTFNDASTGTGIILWSWDFGDGDTALGKNVDHVYDAAGRYMVTLTVGDGTTTDSIIKQVTVLAEDDGGGGGGGTPGGGDGGSGSAEADDPFIPVPFITNNEFYTVDEMFQVIKVDELPSSNTHVRIVFIDSGIFPQAYGEHDLGTIEQLAHPSFTTVTDEMGHGTFVSNVISWGKYNKLPNLEIISYKCFDSLGGCTPDMLLDALDEVKQLRPHILCISAGAYGWPDDVFGQKIQELTNSGIIICTVAGNEGPDPNSILSPASSRCTIGVGAIDPLLTFKIYDDDYVPSWSSRGPVDGVNYIKPDCVAPGVTIIGPYGSSEAILSGSSTSVPFVAVGLATVYAANSGWMDLTNMLWWWEGDSKQEMMLSAFESTSVKMGDIDSFGNGIADFKAMNDGLFMMCLIKIIMALALYACIIGLIVFSIRYYMKSKKGSKTKE